MTHCAEFFEKWKKEPNFCGIGTAAAKQIDQYLLFVDDFAKEYNLNVADIYRNCPSTAIKPILRFKKDSDVRKKATKEIADTLKSRQGITLKFINTIIGLPATPIKMKEEPKVIVAPLSDPHREILAKNTIKDKIRLINSALSQGQRNVLSIIMEKEHLDNEYEAITLAIKWASERLNL